MVCNNCNTENSGNCRFCLTCGNPLYGTAMEVTDVYDEGQDASIPVTAPDSVPPKHEWARSPINTVTHILIPILLLIILTVVFSFIAFLLSEGSLERHINEISSVSLTVDEIRELLKTLPRSLDKPPIARYFSALTNLYGLSSSTRMPVADVIAARLPTTIVLILAGLLIAFALAIPIGIFSASNEDRYFVCSLISAICKSIPFFWLSLIFLKWFSFDLIWLPIGRETMWHHYILPSLILGFSYFGFAAQTISATIIKARDNDCNIWFLPESDINHRQINKNSPYRVLPTIAQSGLQLGWLLIGIIVVENVFYLPGVGRYFIEGIMSRNTPVVFGGIIALSLCFFITAVVAFTAVVLILQTSLRKRGKVHG